MTNQHDLSLLTDEQQAILDKNKHHMLDPDMDLSLLESYERRAFISTLAGGDPEIICWASDWIGRLIAARAENKRKDEVIELADALAYRATEYVSDIESAGDGSEHWKPLTRRLAEYKEQRALLQSEKERCPVHDFEFPCLGCAELALHVGVDEQEQSEKGGE